jgi:hypothetical protein
LLDRRCLREQGVDRRRNVGVSAQEVHRRAAAVAHAPVIKPQHGIARRRQGAREQNKLAVTTDPVLRATDDDDDAEGCGFCRLTQDAQ